MLEIRELINLLSGVVFFIYLLYLIKTQSKPIFTFWFGGILLIFLSQLFTVVEGFVLPDLFNIAEHSAFCVASVFFLFSVIKKEL